MMDREFEFAVDRIQKQCSTFMNFYKRSGWQIPPDIESNEQLEDFLFKLNEISDYDFQERLHEFILNNFKHNPMGDEWYEGGDEWVFEGGKYCWKYYEFDGWHFLWSPEGEIDGLHK